MTTQRTSSNPPAGKIRLPVLIVGFAIVAFFIVMAIITINETEIPGSANLGAVVSSTTNTGSTTVPDDVKPPTSGEVGRAIGVAAGSNLAKLSPQNLDAQLDQMEKAGITWVRFDIEWGLVQYGSPDTSDWSSFDRVVDSLNKHHMKGLAILLFTPQWARNPSCSGGAKCPPADPQIFTKFAVEAVDRYKGKGLHYWEIWNEPNSYDFWATKTDCVAYTNLLKAVYPAMKKADPYSFIVTGGVAPAATDNNNISQQDFLKCIYKNGGKNYFDAFGDHPYTFPENPSAHKTNTWGQMLYGSNSLREIMISNGDEDKKIWMTEFGTPTNGPDPKRFTTEAKQTEMVNDTIKLYKTYDWAGPLFWYTIQDSGTEKNSVENFFGLLRFDGTQKPAYNRLKELISAGL